MSFNLNILFHFQAAPQYSLTFRPAVTHPSPMQTSAKISRRLITSHMSYRYVKVLPSLQLLMMDLTMQLFHFITLYYLTWTYKWTVQV